LFTGLLTITVFLPLAGALIVILLLREPRAVRRFVVAVAVGELALSIAVFASYYSNGEGVELIDRLSWIPALKAEYYLGVDGLSAPMVLLTGLMGMAAVFASWHIEHRIREYFAWLLVLWTAVMGVFTALDFLLFFVFWELELMPMYFLIAIWGSGRREYSAMKFLIFTVLGSAFMLVGILILFVSTQSFDMIYLGETLGDTVPLSNLLAPAPFVFFLFFTGFAIKLPVWPVHTWLPDAHTDAPTAVSVMLAGVLLKMGGYGIIRISVTMFPDVARDYAGWLALFAVISILYGAVVTLRQSDMKRLIAFSSVSHMGFVLLGISSVGAAAATINAVGLTGASMQMFTHGTITGLLFLLVGLLHEKARTRHIPDLGGLASRMPFIAVALVLAGLASLGLPSLSGFVAELLVLLGTFPVWSLATALGAFGIVLTAGYILWMLQRTLFGPSRERFAAIGDVSVMEAVPVVALLAPIIIFGLYPAFLTDVFEGALVPLIAARFG